MRPVQIPSLPEGRVALAALSNRQSYIREALQARGVAVLEIPPDPVLPAPVACHPDLSALCRL